MSTIVSASASNRTQSNNLVCSKCSVSLLFSKVTPQNKCYCYLNFTWKCVCTDFCRSSFHTDHVLHLWRHLLVLSFLYWFDVERPFFFLSVFVHQFHKVLNLYNFPKFIFQILYYSFIQVALVIPALILSKYIPMLNHK